MNGMFGDRSYARCAGWLGNVTPTPGLRLGLHSWARYAGLLMGNIDFGHYAGVLMGNIDKC